MNIRRKLAPAAAASLSLAPLLLFAYLGLHSRPMSDDYCHLRTGLDMGPWHGMLHWRQTWNGSYADYFLHGFSAPLGASASAIAPAVILFIWLGGFCWAILRCLDLLQIKRMRRTAAFTLAASAVAVSINSLFSLESIYWYAASTRYTLPLALLTLYIALTLEYGRQPRSARTTAIALLTSILLCFFCGGLSEIHLALQFTLFTLALPAVFALVKEPWRRPYIIMLLGGWLATLASLATQLTAPVLTIRASRIAETTAPPIRELSHLLSRSIEEVFGYLAESRTFAGFILLLAAGLFLMLVTYHPAARSLIRKPIQFTRLPLLMGLLVQVLCVPLLWTHTSDNPQLLGRYSSAYAVVLLIHAASLIGYATLLLSKRRLNRHLREGARSTFFVSCAALQIVFFLFAITQLRSVHWRAAAYLFINCNLILALLSWLHIGALPKPLGHRFCLSVVSYCAIIFAANIALLLPQLHTYGFLQRRIPAFAPYSIVLLGLMWGAILGYVLKRFAGAAAQDDAALRCLRWSCIMAALVIGAGIFFGYSALISPFQTYASEWEARHSHIIGQRDRGLKSITVQALTFDLDEFMDRKTIDGQTCPPIYFGVERIIVAND